MTGIVILTFILYFGIIPMIMNILGLKITSLDQNKMFIANDMYQIISVCKLIL